MKVLVTGYAGQLGWDTIQLLQARGIECRGVDMQDFDLTDGQAVRAYVQAYRPTAIVHCAAYTNVDKAEEEETVADKLNHVAVGYLADTMKSVGGTLIHVSTDYVFGGNRNNTPCTEEEPVNPTGAYGRTKLSGEEALLRSGCRYLIFRTAWLYSEYGKNFVKTMLSLTADKPSLKVVFDQVGTPTYAGDLAYAIFSIIENGAVEGNDGIYHYSNEGVCSWFDFTKEIARQAGHDDCDIQPCHSNEFPSKVIRPAYSVLDKTKFKQTFNLAVPYWTDSLARCLQNLKADGLR